MGKFTLGGFWRKLFREMAAVSFTLAGSVIVLGTLSGATRTIALVATIVAVGLHFGYVMAEDDQG